MQFLRFLLWPFSLIYGGVVWLRNRAFDYGVLQSKSYNFPLIVVGNLSAGGTGKTPMTAYVLAFLQEYFSVGMLSRGYRRSTKGFVLADETASAKSIGDEPFQLFSSLEDVVVAVDEDRQHGIATLKELNKLPEVLVLDDAYQHRKVKAGFSILLTAFNQLYVDDMMLPAGYLRDHKREASRANCVVVTKCPDDLSAKNKALIKQKLHLKKHQYLFFTAINYANEVKNNKTVMSLDTLKRHDFVLVTGIANPKPLLDFLTLNEFKYQHKAFKDHHNFSEVEIENLRKEKLIITTEKDFARLDPYLDNIFYLPITVKFLDDEEQFKAVTLSYCKSY